MKSNWIRWMAAVLMLLMVPFLISSPAFAEVEPLPLDQLVPGNPILPQGILADTKDHMEYQDESIHVTVTFENVHKVRCSITRITIADPSQIRTAMSKDKYEDRTYVKAAAMAQHVNAVAAVNGDFFKYFYDIGYVQRQGVFYRDFLNGKRDVLAIDSQGDFYDIRNATSDTMKAFLEKDLPAGRELINTFTLGPVLVKNGEVQEITTTEFQYRYKMMRVCVVQLDTLSYAIVQCNGKADATSGMTMKEFAEYVQSIFPDAKLAYNLDGGGSTNVLFNGKRIHHNSDARNISDILYFASAAK